MSWHRLGRDGVILQGLDDGQGLPVIFQHGLGGDEGQVAEIFPHSDYRRLTLDCRGQGQSQAGNAEDFSIQTFSDDVIAFADARGIGRFVIGGISMGAAIALRIAVTCPSRVMALILARPAWRTEKAPENMQVIAQCAQYLRQGDRDGFAGSETARMLREIAPDNLASLMSHFDKPNPHMLARLLAAIAADGPGVTQADVRTVSVPTLVIGTGQDYIHPLSHAEWLAQNITHAQLVEITSKVVDKTKYVTEFKAALAAFLNALEV
ncbi:MAG: alpha/beta fold hydrolase [Rhizobiaceae bacterium]